MEFKKNNFRGISLHTKLQNDPLLQLRTEK